MTRFCLLLIAALVASASTPSPAVAQPDKEQLKSRFNAREQDLRSFKQRGVIGETLGGYVEAVPGSAADEHTKSVVSEENTDRRRLYQILADEINKEHPDAKIKATVETIAVRNAARNIQNARPDEFLRVARDHWIRVREYPRFQRVQTLKAQGKVGETSAGLVEAVKPEDQSDQNLSRLVTEENTARTAEYAALAQREGVEPAVVASRMAQRNVANARVGEMIKEESGVWRKK